MSRKAPRSPCPAAKRRPRNGPRGSDLWQQARPELAALRRAPTEGVPECAALYHRAPRLARISCERLYDVRTCHHSRSSLQSPLSSNVSTKTPSSSTRTPLEADFNFADQRATPVWPLTATTLDVKSTSR